jgi:hypothetical protein
MMMRIIEMLLLKRKPASGFDPVTMLYKRKSPSAGHSDDRSLWSSVLHLPNSHGV